MNKIASKLIDEGYNVLNSKKKFIDFTGETNPDKLLNDLKNMPHAFVIACIVDRQITAERAWLIPYKLKERLGSFEIDYLLKLTEKKILNAMRKPTSLHRFNKTMSTNIYSAIQKIKNEYKGDASKIWKNKPSSALIVYRFLQFKGVGIKIAPMATNILVRNFKIKVSDKYSIDVSPDVQVKRVFKRLNLIDKNATNEEMIYKARSLHPDYPGIFDLSCWEIGREWCRPKRPICNECFMQDVCPSAIQ